MSGPSGERVARVVAVSASPKGGVPKYPQPAVRFHADGVEGDYHRGPTRYSQSQRRTLPNDRTVTIIAAEDLDEINAALGLSLGAGALSENVLVRGLGPLRDVAPGDRIVLSSDAARVTLVVTGQNMPCATLLPYHREIVRVAANKVGDRLENRRGVLCTVEAIEGDGAVTAGASVTHVRAQAG